MKRSAHDPRRRYLLRTSPVKTWMTCPQKFRIEYVLGYEPTDEAKALRLGTIWHRAMEEYLRAIGRGDEYPGPAIADGTGVLFDALMKKELDEWEFAACRPLFVGYVTRWFDEDRATMKVESIEQEVEQELVHPETLQGHNDWIWGGRYDGIVIVNGRRMLIEHKTSGVDITPGSNFWRAKRIDAQASNYIDASGALGAYYDVALKPGLRPYQATPVGDRTFKKDGTLHAKQRLTDETPLEYEQRVAEAIATNPEKFYQRAEIVRTREQLAEAALDRWHNAEAISDALRLDRFPRNTSACFTPGMACPFASVCLDEETLDSPRFQRKEGYE